MSGYRDPWAILGLQRSATDAEIRSAYRKKAREHHPDRHGGDPDAARMFAEISKAYEAIRSPASRDRWLADNESARSHPDGDFPPYPGPAPPRAAPVEQEITIDFRTSYTGTQQEIMIPVDDVCGVCGGSGSAPGYAPRHCTACEGTGQVELSSLSQECGQCAGRGFLVDHPCPSCQAGLVREERPFVIQIPPGVEDGEIIRITGLDRGRFGAAEIRVLIRVQPSPVYSRHLHDRSDLLMRVPITYSEALLGAAIRIPTPEKVIEFRIPPGTASGKTFRISGEGMPKRDGMAERGDLYVEVLIHVPAEPSKWVRKLAQELAEEEDAAQLRYGLFAPEED